MLSPVFHPASRLWMLGKIENNTARPLTPEEIDAHIEEHERLQALAEKSEAAPDSGFLPQIVRLFMVCWDDQQGLCAPMVWDADCQGAICGGIGAKDKVAIFTTRQAARKAIDISTKWNALLKAQGKPYNEDFEGEYRKNLRVVGCLPDIKKLSHTDEKP